MNNQQSEKVGWHFDQTYIKLPKDFFVEQLPIVVSNPKLILLNEPLLKFLGLDKESLSLETWTNIFSGNEIPKKAYPIAQAYAGHQFGHLKKHYLAQYSQGLQKVIFESVLFNSHPH